MARPWFVLKFGGTSVSSPRGWAQIERRVRELLPGRRVLVAASALSGVSDRLERALAEAVADGPADSAAWIRRAHADLAAELGLGGEVLAPVHGLLDEMDRTLRGIALTREASPRLRARVMATGELASTRLGEAWLRARGVPLRWADARELLVTSPRANEAEASRFLDADAPPVHDPARVEAAADGADVVLTQGFIARTERGETCLLGRGGSDTSGALLAALAGAEHLEIWTDVHGMFTSDPRRVPTARLVRRIGYREAQELAAMGAKVLHPRCLGPVARAGIPLTVRNTFDPGAEGTRVEQDPSDEPSVTAVVHRGRTTLVTLSTLAMWESAGFLARAFRPFEDLGISIDLVATSQSAVSVTLDRIPGGVDGEPFAALLARLRTLGEVRVVHPCAVVAVVGRRIRAVLHELGPALAVFREHAVHLVSASSEDLNLSFVVEEDDAAALVADLHARLIPAQGDEERLGPTWESLRAERAPAVPSVAAWWRARRPELLAIAAEHAAAWVYDLPTVRERCRRLRAALPSVSRFLYALKANAHPDVLRAVTGEGFGLECVSAAEVARARAVAGAGVPVLFTPSFCPVDEYAAAFEAGAEVTLEGEAPLRSDPGLFRGREVGLRLDPGRGLGHHDKVRTAGAHAKFGHPIARAAELGEAVERAGARVVGLHAHLGSGIFDPASWARTAAALAALREAFPHLRWIDPGGGFGVPERPGQAPLDLGAVEEALARVRASAPGLEFRLEPGRYVVSEAGVLLARVTQVRRKGGVRFVGAATGMNSLIRPALYGAWHAIHNLSRLDEPPSGYAHVVGPICESGDVLGRDRRLPETDAGDVLLVEMCGAYGAVMSSRYNLREPAAERTLG